MTAEEMVGMLAEALHQSDEKIRAMRSMVEAAHDLMTSSHWYLPTKQGTRCRVCLRIVSDGDGHDGRCSIGKYLKALKAYRELQP